VSIPSLHGVSVVEAVFRGIRTYLLLVAILLLFCKPRLESDFSFGGRQMSSTGASWRVELNYYAVRRTGTHCCAPTLFTISREQSFL